jgi:hypothetical protein
MSAMTSTNTFKAWTIDEIARGSSYLVAECILRDEGRRLLLGLGFKSGLRGDREASQGFIYISSLSLNWSEKGSRHES